MSPPKHPTQSPVRQGRWRLRRRICLLKGCENLFVPDYPQQRYCGEECQEAALKWRRWLKQQTYRATDNGKEHRREQAKRHRKRKKEERKDSQKEEIGKTDQAEAAQSVGNPPATNLEESCCHRPGCYDLFEPHSCTPRQKFCSSLCRNALRRVIEREIRLGLRTRNQRE